MSLTQFLKGLVLILIGVIFILNNLNILDWHVWVNIIKLWPLLLISLGIGFIFRRRLSWLGPLLILIGIIVGIGTSFMGLDLQLESKITSEMTTIQRGLDLSTETVTEVENQEREMLPRINKVNLSLNYSVGSFTLKYSTPLVYQCRVSYRYPEFKPIENFSMLDNEAQVKIYHQPMSDKMVRNPKNQIDLKLNPDIVYNIFLETGATAIDYDLSKFKTENFTIKSGAANINIIAPRYNGTIKIDSGVAKIDIAIPEDVGVMVNLDIGLSKKNFDENFENQEDHTYISHNYNSAPYQVNINIDSGVSKINVYYL